MDHQNKIAPKANEPMPLQTFHGSETCRLWQEFVALQAQRGLRIVSSAPITDLVSKASAMTLRAQAL